MLWQKDSDSRLPDELARIRVVAKEQMEADLRGESGQETTSASTVLVSDFTTNWHGNA